MRLHEKVPFRFGPFSGLVANILNRSKPLLDSEFLDGEKAVRAAIPFF
jgi:hypothetical protein